MKQKSPRIEGFFVSDIDLKSNLILEFLEKII